MEVIHGLPGRRPGDPPVVLTIGAFDGVHRGHHALLRRVAAEARRLSASRAVITFDPHPRCVVDPQGCPPLLSSIDERVDLLRAEGVDRCAVIPFTREFSRLSADHFADALVTSFPLRRMVVGPRFALGHARTGDIRFLRAHGATHGYDVVEVPPLVLRGEVVSSTRIRTLLAVGRLGEANRLLGRAYTLAGTIVSGERLGATLGFPTANLAVDSGRCLPATGIYATWLWVHDTWHPTATSVGFRPTFDGNTITVEAHVLGFSGDLYGADARLAFVRRLRAERRFASAAALSRQIARDVERVGSLLAGSAPPA